MARIFKLTEKAIENEMEWDAAIAENEIETVAEFETYAEAVAAFDNGNYDAEVFGVE